MGKKRSRAKKRATPPNSAGSTADSVLTDAVEESAALASVEPVSVVSAQIIVPIAFSEEPVADAASEISESRAEFSGDGNELRWCLGVAIFSVVTFAAMAMAHHAPTPKGASLQKPSPLASSSATSTSPKPNTAK